MLVLGLEAMAGAARYWPEGTGPGVLRKGQAFLAPGTLAAGSREPQCVVAAPEPDRSAPKPGQDPSCVLQGPIGRLRLNGAWMEGFEHGCDAIATHRGLSPPLECRDR